MHADLGLNRRGTRNRAVRYTQVDDGTRRKIAPIWTRKLRVAEKGLVDGSTVHAVRNKELRVPCTTCVYRAKELRAPRSDGPKSACTSLRNCWYRAVLRAPCGKNCVQHDQLREPCGVACPGQDHTTIAFFASFPPTARMVVLRKLKPRQCVPRGGVARLGHDHATSTLLCLIPASDLHSRPALAETTPACTVQRDQLREPRGGVARPGQNLAPSFLCLIPASDLHGCPA